MERTLNLLSHFTFRKVENVKLSNKVKFRSSHTTGHCNMTAVFPSDNNNLSILHHLIIFKPHQTEDYSVMYANMKTVQSNAAYMYGSHPQQN